MPSNDDDWRELFDLLEAGLGSRTAALLMAHLPPADWAELATKSDLAGLRSELKGEMAEMRGEMRGEMAEVRGAMTALRSEFKGEMAEMRGDTRYLRGEMVNMRAEMIERIAHSQLTVQATTIGTMIGLSGLVFAVASFAQ